MGLAIVQADAFTNQAFGGNPAAVCVLPAPKSDEWMQKVALEMNLSETAFLLPESDGYRLRWFTPAVEVDLCGHATLASAHVLWSEGYLSADQDARFYTRSGPLFAHKNGDWIELNFPASPIQEGPVPPEVASALNLRVKTAGLSRDRFLLVEVETEAEVRAAQPDFATLKQVDVHGVIVTSRSASADFDVVSRFFAPALGINEDPVTGSAHCVLAPFWRDRLGKDDLMAYQASSRGGVLRIHYDGGDRVVLAGQAVTVMRGALGQV